MLDGNNSILRFQVNNKDTTRSLTPDHSCDCFFQKVEVLHGGTVLEVIDNYHQLSSLLLDSQVPTNLRNTSYNMTKGCNATAGTIAGVAIAANGSRYYTTTLISGIVGSLARNYIPVNELQGSIQIRITIVGIAQTTWVTAAATASPAFTIDNIEFHANMIRVAPDVMNMIRSREYTIYITKPIVIFHNLMLLPFHNYNY